MEADIEKTENSEREELKEYIPPEPIPKNFEMVSTTIKTRYGELTFACTCSYQRSQQGERDFLRSCLARQKRRAKLLRELEDEIGDE